MSTADWGVLAATLAAIVAYGVYRGRKQRDIGSYFLADRSMPWYAVALSIMATQASAITFTSTPGLGFTDGLRFVQFYLGLPLAMVILSVTAVPMFRNAGVYTAYEYLEKRFDPKMRVLTSLIFLVQRGLGVGITIYAPSLVLSTVLGWNLSVTSCIIGGAVIVYSVSGGVKAIQWTHVQQMIVILAGMAIAFGVAVSLLPEDVSLAGSLRVAGALGKVNPIDLSFDPDNRYTLWSGLLGGMFVALAYFGTDQSQVQRYLTGESITSSRLGLMFNAVIKVPMQFGILLLGVVVFTAYQFHEPPVHFDKHAVEDARAGPLAGDFAALEERHAEQFRRKLGTVKRYAATGEGRAELEAAGREAEALRREGAELIGRSAAARESAAGEAPPASGAAGTAPATGANGTGPATVATPPANDTNYIFLTFVTDYLPVGLVGLLFACIFAATMSSSSGELGALASCTVVDIYRRHIRPGAGERHYLVVSRIAMAFWGLYAIAFAQFAGGAGALIETVNIVGSLFYGTMLGIFALAFGSKRIGGGAAFAGALAGEAVVFACHLWTDISWLWYNVVGCFTVVAVALIWTAAAGVSCGRAAPGSPGPPGSQPRK